jgi:hypothetical protein
MSSHTCLSYEFEEDLLEIESSFFMEGVRARELCLWVVPQSLGIIGAKEALSKKIKNIDMYIRDGQFELLSHNDVYLRSGIFDPDYTATLLDKKEHDALEQGFSGLRISGDASWLPENEWNVIINYEKNVDKLIPQKKIVALCTYPSGKFGIDKVFELCFFHDSIIKKEKDKVAVFIDKKSICK